MAGRDVTMMSNKRVCRKSPEISICSESISAQPPPISPTPSVTDTTFEPTIDMMVNDFDDEATLNEEEALADMEAHNTDDEIATLREESEMPIEQLLAKYSSMTNVNLSTASPTLRSISSSRRRRAAKRPLYSVDASNIASASTNEEPDNVELHSHHEEALSPIVDSPSSQFNKAVLDDGEMTDKLLQKANTKTQHRSHLFDLYPDESFGSRAQNTMSTAENFGSFTPLQTLFEEVEKTRGQEDSDTDSDDARKNIMVGPDFQAEIPDGLSQYGDILPYENEDQLIWEPSQVSELEVEKYLARIQETSPLSITAEDGTDAAAAMNPEIPDEIKLIMATATNCAPIPTDAKGASSSDVESVVKDNEQALHLLVQCGYDFKEALRRKLLNVLPLSDTMSTWSEEECQKFEEGIQKFGKDFYQIRQNQVRTRTMRELVHFYYLWKKSERRDQSFALNDTIDHMDAFINEACNADGNENNNENANSNGNGYGSCSPHASSCSSSNGYTAMENNFEKDALKKPTTKNYSIMAGGQSGGAFAGGAGNVSRKLEVSFTAIEQEQEDNDSHVNIKESFS